MGTILLSPDELITSTAAAARLPRLLDTLDGGRWFIQRRNKIEGVLIGLAEYERLTGLEELLDHVLLARLIAEREQVRPEEYQDLDRVLQDLSVEVQA